MPCSAYAAAAISSVRSPAWWRTRGRMSSGNRASAAGTVRFNASAPGCRPAPVAAMVPHDPHSGQQDHPAPQYAGTRHEYRSVTAGAAAPVPVTSATPLLESASMFAVATRLVPLALVANCSLSKCPVRTASVGSHRAASVLRLRPTVSCHRSSELPLGGSWPRTRGSRRCQLPPPNLLLTRRLIPYMALANRCNQFTDV